MFLHLLFSVTNPFLPPCSDFELQRLVVWAILTPAAFPMAHLRLYGHTLNGNVSNVATLSKLGSHPVSGYFFRKHSIDVRAVENPLTHSVLQTVTVCQLC